MSGKALTAWFDLSWDIVSTMLSPDLLPAQAPLVRSRLRFYDLTAEIAAIIADRHFDHLDAPVRRHASPDVRFPASPVLQDALLPSSSSIIAMARDLMRV
jgi:pyruvate/2-oxoglutarate/acetoin dehydrogenase E1 component